MKRRYDQNGIPLPHIKHDDFSGRIKLMGEGKQTDRSHQETEHTDIPLFLFNAQQEQTSRRSRPAQNKRQAVFL